MSTLRAIVQFCVYYRRWLSVALVLAIAYGIMDSQRPGQEVLVATETIAEGQPLHDLKVMRAAEFPDNVAPIAIDAVEGFVAKFPMTAGTIITQDNIAQVHPTDTVIVSLPIEPIAVNSISNGSTIHVWALFEDHSSLVSVTARLLSVSRSSMSTIATLEIPAADEYEVMQANGLRIAGVAAAT
jgi:hypothetical protein